MSGHANQVKNLNANIEKLNGITSKVINEFQKKNTILSKGNQDCKNCNPNVKK